MKRILVAACALAALIGAAAAKSHRSAAPPPVGVKEVDAEVRRLTFYSASPADFRATKLIGWNVHNLNNEVIGEVEDIIIDNGNMVTAIVVGVGGFLGIGERSVAITPSSMVISEVGDSPRLVVNTTREDLKNAPAFNVAGVDKDVTGRSVSAPSSSKNRWLASDIYRANVYDESDNKIGRISDLVIDDDGKVTMVVVGDGGLLGANKTQVGVPFEVLQKSSRNGKSWVVIRMSKDDLMKAPAYKKTSEK